MNLAQLFRRLRGRTSQAEVAQRAHVRQDFVAKVEHGQEPRFQAGWRLARALGATAEELDEACRVEPEEAEDG